MGHWTPTGIELTDYDDDDELCLRLLQDSHLLNTNSFQIRQNKIAVY